MITTSSNLRRKINELKELGGFADSEMIELLEFAFNEIKAFEMNISSLEEENEDLKEDNLRLENELDEFKSNEDLAIQTLEKYADHSNWKDGNIWYPHDWSLGRDFGDELANKAIQVGALNAN